jgi:hypothetical protein
LTTAFISSMYGISLTVNMAKEHDASKSYNQDGMRSICRVARRMPASKYDRISDEIPRVSQSREKKFTSRSWGVATPSTNLRS